MCAVCAVCDACDACVRACAVVGWAVGGGEKKEENPRDVNSVSTLGEEKNKLVGYTYKIHRP